MASCCPHSKSASRFFSFFAGRYRRRLDKKGLEKSQQQLLNGITHVGFQNASILEIGSGVGYFHQTLLERGAKNAIGVDLAPRMITEARQRAEEHGLHERTRYIEGDFVSLDTAIAPADITILDKVVCCYPDAESLVNKSLVNTRRVYALTYPRNLWYTRFAEKVGRVLMWLLRSDFRSYVHDPILIEKWIHIEGFDKVFEASTAIWLTQVYRKTGDST